MAARVRPGLRLVLARGLALGAFALGATAPARPRPWAVTVAVLDVLVVAGFIARRAEVRLVLALGALPLFLAAGKLPALFGRAASEMANPLTVVPICSAMGFAYVCRLTECDRHLVQLLLLPLRRVRALLIPGGIAAAYVVNSAIVSQTGTAAVIGPILIPLLRASGVSATTAGSLLLLGSSMGGELFNPGAVEVRTLAKLTGRSGNAVVERMTPLNLAACATALAVFWLQAWLRRRRADAAGPPEDHDPDAPPKPGEAPITFRVNPIKAVVPPMPLALLFLASAFFESRLPAAFSGPARILAAMALGVAAAGLTAPKLAPGLAPAFFEGTGYAYTHVISLIVTATVYADGIKETGLIESLIPALVRWPTAALLVAIVFPWLLATVSGTGIGAAVAVMTILVPEAGRMGLDPLRLGTLTALAAHFGRTMSPSAAVVMMCSTLTQTPPSALIRRVLPPLLAGGAVLVIAALIA